MLGTSEKKGTTVPGWKVFVTGEAGKGLLGLQGGSYEGHLDVEGDIRTTALLPNGNRDPHKGTRGKDFPEDRVIWGGERFYG